MANWFDITLSVVMLLSVVTGFSRGFLKESMAVSAWVIAFILGYVYAETWSVYLSPYVDSSSLRIILVSLIILVSCLIAGKVLTKIMTVLLQFSGLKGLDHILGLVFGAARGWLIVVIVVMGLASLHLNQDAWFTESKVVPWAQQTYQEFKQRIPKEIISWWHDEQEGDGQSVTKQISATSAQYSDWVMGH